MKYKYFFKKLSLVFILLFKRRMPQNISNSIKTMLGIRYPIKSLTQAYEFPPNYWLFYIISVSQPRGGILIRY